LLLAPTAMNSQLDHYHVIDLIGEGSFGKVSGAVPCSGLTQAFTRKHPRLTP